MRSADYLAFYAEHFHTVEVDSTFYGCPTARTVSNWAARTPEGFIFSVKVPQTITHEKALVDCDAEFAEFVETMSILGAKLGPMVFQFPFFDKWKIKDRHAFTDRLIPFLRKLPAAYKFAIEIRNKKWLDAEFAGVLREHKVALVLQDLSYMPGPKDLTDKFDPITVEKLTLTWDKTVVDRTAELSSWVDFCYQIKKRGVLIYAYANNHYAGHAPATIEQFRHLWHAKGLPELNKPPRMRPKESLLFE